MHWADVMAQRLAERGDRHIVATGITPSGEFHIGHIREILTGDMIARVHDVERTGTAPVEYFAKRDGIYSGRHFPGQVKVGDFLGMVAVPVDAFNC